jgi:hypothetical protein
MKANEKKELAGGRANAKPPAAEEESQIIDTPLQPEAGPKLAEDDPIPTEPMDTYLPSEPNEHNVEGSQNNNIPVEQEHVPKPVDDDDIPLEITSEASVPSEPHENAVEESQKHEKSVEPEHLSKAVEEKAVVPSEPSKEAGELPNSGQSADPEALMAPESQVALHPASAKPSNPPLMVPETSLTKSPVVLAPENGLTEAHEPPLPNDSDFSGPAEGAERVPEPTVILVEGPGVVRGESFPVKEVLLHEPMAREASQGQEKCDCSCVIL